MQDFMLYLAFYGLIVVIVILAQVLVAAQQVGLSTLAGNREDLVLTGLAGRMERAANNSLLALALVAAKLLNLSSNIAALTLFTMKGHVWWHMALPLAMANVAGSLLGTRMALQHGAGFVRGMFIVVVSALICKTSYDAFLR